LRARILQRGSRATVAAPPGALTAVLCAVTLVLAGVVGAGAARGATVWMLPSRGRPRRVEDRYLPADGALTPPPEGGPWTADALLARRPAVAHTATRALAQLRARGAISAADYRVYVGQLRLARRALRRLRGIRAAQLRGVLDDLEQIAATGKLTSARLAPLFLTLQRNVQWWTRGTLLGYGARVEFSGSQLVWEYYPGQGLQLQMLASFGRANGLYSAGPSHYSQMEALLSQLIGLAVPRAGGLAWEYYFRFDGGSPPWISAMAQGTALEALGRAYQATHNPYYLQIGSQALAPLRARPPVGVSVKTTRGLRFLQYSFAPAVSILNAFLQTLIGLHAYYEASHDPLAAALFAAGNAEAMYETPQFDTGAWSLYQPGIEDSLSYHLLVTGFLQRMCQITVAEVYCRTAARFRSYLKTPPVLRLLTTRARAGAAILLRFDLSKISHVGVVITRGARTVFLTSAQFPYGLHSFSLPPLAAGRYQVRLAATDLAGNFARIAGTLLVHRAPHRSRHGHGRGIAARSPVR
jgi:hypothetical protein